MSATYPTYAVRNPWVDFSKESMSKYFPVSHEGLEAAITYCAKHNLSCVVFLKDKFSVEEVWTNPHFGKSCPYCHKPECECSDMDVSPEIGNK